VKTPYGLEEWRVEQISPQGDSFTPGDKFHPWGTTSPLGSKFAHRGEVKNGPQKLKSLGCFKDKQNKNFHEAV
jgi:hypothetical protein